MSKVKQQIKTEINLKQRTKHNENIYFNFGGIIYYEKTVIASSLAVTLGLTGYALTNDHSAHASEQTTNYSHLADLAQNNPSELNAHPVQAGAYDISFVKDGFKYNFTSNGNTWSWNYTYTGGADTAQSTTDYTESYNQASTQSVSSNNQASTSNVKAVSAPVQRTSSYNNYSARITSYSAPKQLHTQLLQLVDQLKLNS